eukprot:Clim_evm40s199 gene=Clim_evmTU40s199
MSSLLSFDDPIFHNEEEEKYIMDDQGSFLQFINDSAYNTDDSFPLMDGPALLSGPDGMTFEEDGAEEPQPFLPFFNHSAMDGMRSGFDSEATLSLESTPMGSPMSGEALNDADFDFLGDQFMEDVQEETEEEEEVDVMTVSDVATPRKRKNSSGSRKSESESGEKTRKRRRYSRADNARKRRLHNVQEKRRREDMKGSFCALRDNIPDLIGDDRIAKIVILRKAMAYIDTLRQEETDSSAQLAALEQEQKALKARLNKIKA